MAARFHRGLANAIVRMVEQLAAPVAGAGQPLPAVALSGGVFQNRILFERVLTGLESKGFRVLTHGQVPCNDGGLSLGQAAIAAARLLRTAAADHTRGQPDIAAAPDHSPNLASNHPPGQSAGHLKEI